jgi:hypothetical protein
MKAAVFLGTLQAGYTDFNYISLHWKQNAESEDAYDWGAEALQELADGLTYLACAMDVAQDEEAIRRFGHATMKICEAVGALYSHQEEFK